MEVFDLSEDWITVIDEKGFWRGRLLDTSKNREILRENGFEVSKGCTTKQYVDGGEKMRVSEIQEEIEELEMHLIEEHGVDETTINRREGFYSDESALLGSLKELHGDIEEAEK